MAEVFFLFVSGLELIVCVFFHESITISSNSLKFGIQENDKMYETWN